MSDVVRDAYETALVDRVNELTAQRDRLGERLAETRGLVRDLTTTLERRNAQLARVREGLESVERWLARPDTEPPPGLRTIRALLAERD